MQRIVYVWSPASESRYSGDPLSVWRSGFSDLDLQFKFEMPRGVEVGGDCDRCGFRYAVRMPRIAARLRRLTLENHQTLRRPRDERDGTLPF